MTDGWKVLEPLERASPTGPIDQATVDQVCDQLTKLNADLRDKVEAALREKKLHKWADGVNREWARSDEALFNTYFANKAYSFLVPRSPPDRLDGRRMAVVFHMSERLQSKLLEHLRGVSTAEVANASYSPSPEAFQAVYRFANLLAMVAAIKSVQYDVEDFAFRATDLLQGTTGQRHSFRASAWTFDADMMDEQILLGFMRTPSPASLNSRYLSSPTVAAGLIRSHLESVLFRTDFDSSLAGSTEVTAQTWAEALRQHRDAGDVSLPLSQWVTELYGLLSMALHSGAALSRGEVWAFMRVVDQLQAALGASHPQSFSIRWPES
jgi:hypothetical protein